MNRPSKQTSFNLTVAAAALTSLSNLFLMIALVSDYWIYGNGYDGILYLGIWKGCRIDGCGSQTGGPYVKAILIVCFIFSFLVNLLFLLHFKYDFSTIKNFKVSMGKTMMIISLFEISGMANASVLFILSAYYGGLHYAYFMGWIATCLALAAGIVSYYHGRIEPEIEVPQSTIQGTTEAKSDNPPPYTIMP